MIETATPWPAVPRGPSHAEAAARWQAFGRLGADFMFEADASGRLTFVSPDFILGRSAAAWLGRPAAGLFWDHGQPAPDPFRVAAPVRDRRVWITGTDGVRACFAITAEPVVDAHGTITGTRGIGVDVTEQERTAARTGAALHRGEALERILTLLRQEETAPRMMEAVLTEAMQAMGAAGAAVIAGAPFVQIMHAVGADVAPILPDAVPLIDGDPGERDAQIGIASSGMQMLACPATTRFGEHAHLLAWRHFRNGEWTDDDRLIAGAVTGVIRIVLEHEAIQRQLAMQCRTDAATGLFNRIAFMEEAARRIDRLDRESQPGTLLCLDIDRFSDLSRRVGHDGAEALLSRTGDLLRRTFRPTDLLARFGGESFAVWLDGSDELTAAERADSLRLAFPIEMTEITGADAASLTIGIACRAAGSDDALTVVLQQAAQALEHAKRAQRTQGGGQWRVWQPGRA